MFPQEGHLFLTKGGIDLEETQVWLCVFARGELTYLEVIAVLSGLAVGAAALADEALDQHSTCFSGTKQWGDVLEPRKNF